MSQSTSSTLARRRTSVKRPAVPRTVAEAEELARAYFKRSEYTLIKGSGSVVGDPALRAKTLVEITGVGKRCSGTYYVTKITHSIGDGLRAGAHSPQRR